MPDYSVLLARALAGLERNTREARLVVYDTARQSLRKQLLAVRPALSENEITRERLVLEEAIKKIDGEASQAEVRETRYRSPRDSYRTRSDGDGYERPSTRDTRSAYTYGATPRPEREPKDRVARRIPTMRQIEAFFSSWPGSLAALGLLIAAIGVLFTVLQVMK